ncbi:hypothetical protein Ancab_006097 [Ancistrocladus abbreviatus]
MTKRERTKVRFVICPRCSKVLPEPKDVPFYKCGGCGTVLQAKYYKREDERMRMGSDGPGPNQNDKPDHKHDGGESRTSSEKSSSDGQCSQGQDAGTDKNAFRNRDLKQLGVGSSDSEASTSSQPSLLERKEKTELPAESERVERLDDNIVGSDNPEQSAVAISHIPASLSKDKTLVESEKSLQLVTAGREVEGRDDRKSNQEQLAPQNFVTEASLSNEPTLVKSEDSLSEIEVMMDETVVGNHKEEQIGVVNSLHETASANDHMLIDNTESLQLVVENGVIHNRMDQDELEDARQAHLVGDPSSRNLLSGESNCYERDNSLAEASPNKEASGGEDQNEFADCVTETLGNINLSREALESSDLNWEENRGSPPLLEANMEVNKNGCDSASPSTGEVHSSHIAPEPEFESDLSELTRDPHQQGDKPENKDADELKCVSSSNALASAELVNANLQVDRSVKEFRRSTTRSSFAYDGSVSSMDGNSHLDREPLGGHYEADECIGADDKWDNLMANKMTSSSPEIQDQYNDSPVASPNKNNEHHSVQASMSTLDELLEGAGRRIRGKMMRPKREEFPSRVPMYLGSLGMGYESSSSSSYMHDEYSAHLMHHPPYGFDDPKSGFDGRYIIHNENVGRIFPEASAKIYRDSRYHGYCGGNTEDFRPYGIARIPYSGETTSSFGDANGLHLHPDDMRWSSHLPPPDTCCSSGLCMAPPSHRSWSRHDSLLGSPHHFTDPEAYAWGHFAFSNDQRHRDHMRRKSYSRKKHQPVQRHFRPIAGAAPFVTCYECLELLQLPADFLLFRKRTHQLKCGKCSRVLKFSLANGLRIFPYTPNTVLPPTEVVESGANGSLNSVPSSHTNGHPHNRFSHRSCSSVGGDQILSADRAEGPMQNSVMALGRQKSSLKTENSGKHDQAGTSSDQSRKIKVSWELPARSSSPLHRLMGYSSPTELLEGQSGSRNSRADKT